MQQKAKTELQFIQNIFICSVIILFLEFLNYYLFE